MAKPRKNTRTKLLKKVDGILVSVTNSVWYVGTHKIKKELTPAEYSHFQLFIARTLEYELKKAIDKQRYAKGISRGSNVWSPLNKLYIKYKEDKQLSTNIWEATGILKRNIHVFRRNNYLVVGFENYDYYPSTKLPINRVARWVEYGTAKMPARPLFRPIVAYMRRNIDRYLKKFFREYLLLSVADTNERLKRMRR